MTRTAASCHSSQCHNFSMDCSEHHAWIHYVVPSSFILFIPIFMPLLLYWYMHFLGGVQLKSKIISIGKQIHIGDYANPLLDETIVGKFGNYVHGYITWQCTSFIYIFICLVAIIISIMMIKQYQTYRLFVYFMIVIIIVNFTWSIVIYFIDRAYGSVVDAVIGIFLPLNAPWLDQIKVVAFTTRLLSALAFILLSFASFSVISLSFKAKNLPGDKAASFLSEQLSHIRIILYIGSACLFSGIFTLQAFFALQESVIPEIFLNDMEELGNAVLLIWTVQWSIALSGIYLFPTYILYRRVDAIFKAQLLQPNGVERQKWMENHGLAISFGQVIIKAVALLGPVLAGAQVVPSLLAIFA